MVCLPTVAFRAAPAVAGVARHVAAAGLATAVTCSAFDARADVAIDARRGDAYYAAHWASTGVAAVGALLIDRWSEHAGGYDWDWFPGDLAIRAYFRDSAAAMSDSTLVLTLGLPLGFHAGAGADRGFGNASLVYAEVQASQVLLNAFVKHAVARPRPYTHSSLDHVRSYAEKTGIENYVSFYSGHTGSSFAAAISGAYLFSLRSPDPWARRLAWGSEFALASTTATLRVVAGRHYVSDVLVGAVIGSGIGIAVPLLHGYREPIENLHADLAAGAIGLSTGVAVGAVLTALRIWDEELAESAAAIPLAPYAFEGGFGIASLGTF